MDFTWVMNPARRYVPAIHVEPLAHADDLNERFPGAEACQFMGASQHGKHRIFLKTLPFRRRGLRISPAMGCDEVRGEEEHLSAVPRPAGLRGSVGQGEEGKGETERGSDGEGERGKGGERERGGEGEGGCEL